MALNTSSFVSYCDFVESDCTVSATTSVGAVLSYTTGLSALGLRPFLGVATSPSTLVNSIKSFTSLRTVRGVIPCSLL